jgi:hypothetical protein
METWVTANSHGLAPGVVSAPGARLSLWQRLLLWLVTRDRNLKSLVIHHRNGKTVWAWHRFDPERYAPHRHLERCLHKSP